MSSEYALVPNQERVDVPNNFFINAPAPLLKRLPDKSSTAHIVEGFAEGSFLSISAGAVGAISFPTVVFLAGRLLHVCVAMATGINPLYGLAEIGIPVTKVAGIGAAVLSGYVAGGVALNDMQKKVNLRSITQLTTSLIISTKLGSWGIPVYASAATALSAHALVAVLLWRRQ